MLVWTDANITNDFTIVFAGPLLLYVKQQECGACVRFNAVYAQLEREREALGLPENMQFATVVITRDLLTKAAAVRLPPPKYFLNIEKTPTLILFNKHQAIAMYSGVTFSIEDILNTFLVPALQADGVHIKSTALQQQYAYAQPPMAQMPAPQMPTPQMYGGVHQQHHQQQQLPQTPPFAQPAYAQPPFASKYSSADKKRNLFSSSTFPEYFDRETPDTLIPKDASVSWSEKRQSTFPNR
jgi:thiol-disulfide isomerase/thioredoxin